MKSKLLENVLQSDLLGIDSLKVFVVHVKELDGLGHHFSDDIGVVLWMIDY